VAGGNLSQTDGPICIDVTLLGRVERDRVVLRSGARVGDVIGVTGTLGAQAALRLAYHPGRAERLAVPRPRLEFARAAAASGKLHAMLDISDGLASDLDHIATASGVGAVLYASQIPIALAARKLGEERGLDPLDLALNGGEDYELLFTAAEEDWPDLVEAAGSLPLYQIGTVLRGEHGLMVERDGGRRKALIARGWTHF
jgi:thiamine-monophosphate kinase